MGATESTVLPPRLKKLVTVDPRTQKPNLTRGQWLCYHSDWEEEPPMMITFTHKDDRPRFYLGDNPFATETDMIGSWSIAGPEMRHQVLLIFDNDMSTLREFNWVDNFNWSLVKEPKSRLKARE